jgi:zinc transport system substrate-binding protein
MRKVKAIVCMILIALLFGGAIFSLVYFSKDDEDKKIVVTTFPIYDICREILGSEEDIMLLQDNGADMHSYQPSAKDITAISKAELFVFIGGESDSWVGDIIRSSGNVNLQRLCLINHVDKLEESYDGIVDGDHIHHHEHENGEEHSDDCYDEHIWLSIRNMKKMTEAILIELINVYPHMEQLLIENANEYIEKLDDLDQRYTEVCKNKETTIVMADRFPFLYLAHDYGLNFLAAYHGCSSDTQASVSIISKLIEKVNAESLNYICVLENSDRSIADSVRLDNTCRSGVNVLTINSCQSVSLASAGKTNYLDIMESNLNSLRKALNNENI